MEILKIISGNKETKECLWERGDGESSSKQKNRSTPEIALSVSGGYPEIAQKGGQEGSTLSSRGTKSQKRKGQYFAFKRNGHQEVFHQIAKNKKKVFLFSRHWKK